MKITAFVVAAASCLTALTAVANAQAVKVNWRVHAPFADYKTYTWQPSQDQQNSFYRQFVREYVDEQMTKKQLTKALPNAAALTVAYHFTTVDLMDSTTTSDGFSMGGGPWGGWSGWGGWGGWGGIGLGMGGMDSGMSTTEERPRTMGILTIDLIDTKTKRVVWRGQATEDSLAKNQKGDEKQMKKSVEKMFDQYPPKKS